MKHLQFTEMTHEVYTIMAALRGPDCKVLANALKWVITGRIRFYVMGQCSEFATLVIMRRDSRADSSWEKAHRGWDKMIEVGVPRRSLDHWTDHAGSALMAIRNLCTTEAHDNKLNHRDEIDIMDSLLSSARTALSPCSDPDEVAEAQQTGHRQLTMLQNITDDLAQAQEATNE